MDERFTWKEGDLQLVSTPKWDLVYVSAEGQFWVDSIELLVKYLSIDHTPTPEAEKKLLDMYVLTLTSEDVANMPLDLREELLDAGYALP